VSGDGRDLRLAVSEMMLVGVAVVLIVVAAVLKGLHEQDVPSL
jgi:hypothetical protein